MERKEHWDGIYSSKKTEELSWYQPDPIEPLHLFNNLQLQKSANIIDIGGGDSLFVDALLQRGYSNISVLDISQKSIERAKLRLGKLAEKVKWIVADASQFIPDEKYDFWHDRAAFHFLTEPAEISGYLNALDKGLHPNGMLFIGTFSTHGPTQCSGINIRQYSQDSMAKQLGPGYQNLECLETGHKTPSGSIQNFIFCSYRKK